VLGAAQLLVLVNVFWSLKFGKDAGNDPWDHHPDTRTFEWETTSPPPHYNFADLPTVQTAVASHH
jgi:heme/copper-type cytochrome/quinol oxidase subunit 1